MIVPSPWLKKILKLEHIDCFKMACLNDCTFTMVEENFDIVTS